MKKKTVLAGAMAVVLTLSQFFGTAALAETVDTTEGSVTKDFTDAITDGLTVNAKGGNSATVTATDVSNSDGADGVYAGAYGEGSSVDVTAKGDVSGTYSGISVDPSRGSTITVDVTGNVSGTYFGINADAYSGSTSEVTITGNVEGGYGVYAYASTDSTTNVTVTGDVTGSYTGIEAEAYDGGSTTVTVTGNVSATGDVSTGNGEEYDGGRPDGIHLCISSGDVTVSVKDKDDPNDSDISGNVTSTGAGLYMSKFVPDNDNEEGTLMAVADDQTGAAASSGSADVLIEGVLHGDTAAVMVSENVTPDDLKLTVWKVDPVNDKIVEFEPEYTEPEIRPLSVQLQSITLTNEGTNTADTGAASSDADKETKRQALEKSIQYIIKVEQPKEGATLTATGKGGAALAVSHDHSVAKEGEEVYLKVDLQKGFKITGAFNGLGQKVALLKDASGNYYVAVPKGGGVYLTAELEKVQEEKKEEKKTGSSGSRSGSGNTRMGYWKQDAHGWYYQFVNGGIARNTVFYIDQKSSDGYTPGYYGFGEDGYMKTGWALINNYWYYFDPASGLMMYGWQNINGKDYYLNPGVLSTGTFAIPIGALYMNTTTPDGYKVDASGARV